MKFEMEKYKGTHPGLLLARELETRGVRKRHFALSIQEYPQVINEITKAKRGITATLSLKIDSFLGLEQGSMFILQAYYEIEIAKKNAVKHIHPDLNIIRKILFWDTEFENIQWVEQYHAVIRRVFERGNDEEKAEILKFYGKQKVKEVTGKDMVISNQLDFMPGRKN